MYPHERSLVRQTADKPFALIGVNSDRNKDQLRERMEEEGITWRSFWNGPEGTGGPISAKWNVRGWPTIYVLDEAGVIRHKNARGSAMDEAVTTLLAEMGVELKLEHTEETEAKPEKSDAEESDAEAEQ